MYLIIIFTKSKGSLSIAWAGEKASLPMMIPASVGESMKSIMKRMYVSRCDMSYV
jgi:hypothetical protein